ncbi:hypothetical protein MTR67_003085 [Solanum verrucosum]|uniref:Uncharacterized protein n=1 Tax=Solanum verrucosum TaxID=315347 RepID=A0AAF0TDV2_SOLVR|nr:hypothetical protein MTR67_003085 [Solanum verrucosum]
MIQNAKKLKAKVERRCTKPKGRSPSTSMIPTNCAEWSFTVQIFENYKYPFNFVA